MERIAQVDASDASTTDTSTLDGLLDRLKDLSSNIVMYVNCLGEDAAFQSLDTVIAELSSLAYSRSQWLDHVRDYCARHVSPVVAESELARLISGEGENSAKGGYRVMENIWSANESEAARYAGLTRRGGLLNAYNCHSDNARANVARIEWFASILSGMSHADIAALGSGSAIEIRAHLAQGDKGNQIFVFDQCAQACEKARQINQPHLASRVEAVCGNPIVGLIRSKKSYDFIYALGMLDYFSEEDSLTLCRKLLARVKPGGMLILGNARPESKTRLWLEMMGGWNLNYKSDNTMHRLGEGVAEGAPYQVLTDSFGVYNFLKINKE